MPPSLPTVSVLMGAYNYEQYVERALESALAQDYPPELLEVVVVDDGSTDSTAAVIEAVSHRHPGRIRLISQANGGYIAATNRAMAEARGDLLALLDADDMWLPHKTRCQVELLQGRPALGLVFSDMIVVDGQEATVRPSQIGAIGSLPRRAFARVLLANVATQSSIMVRASLRELYDPIPPGIPYADWWITLRAAQVSEIDYVREPLALYREHGANLTGGVSGAAGVREHRKEVAFQLWVLRHLPPGTLTPEEMTCVWNGVEERARLVMTSAGSLFAQVAEPRPEQADDADTHLTAAERRRAEGDLVAEAEATLRALAADPSRLGARARLNDSVARAQAYAAAPNPLEGARRFVVLADAEELLEAEELLVGYANALGGSDHVTLAIDASRLPVDTAGATLGALVDRCGLSRREDIDLLAVIGERDEAEHHRLLSGCHARYRREAGGLSSLPVVTPATLGQLHALASRATS